MQALEWTLLGGNHDNSLTTTTTTNISENNSTPQQQLKQSSSSLVQSAVIIGCGARHSAWQIAISSTQRQAIFNDPKWNGGRVDPR